MMPGAASRTDRVVVAMSGGVDSSVAAALLVEQGYSVFGVTFALLDEAWASQKLIERQSASIERARQVCGLLGIEHRVLDEREAFFRDIVMPFVNEYAAGRTPNPCTLCNPTIKFSALERHASERGARYIATGHYARVAERNGQLCVRKGRDERKDQSYFLYRLDSRVLKRVVFPLGDLTKQEVRDLAIRFFADIVFAQESQEVCFVDRDYRELVARLSPTAATPGEIVDEDGTVLGTHSGLLGYTVGQRRGLGIAAGHPLYVIAIDPELNRIVVGPEERAFVRAIELEHVVLQAQAAGGTDFACAVRVRYRMKELPARVRVLEAGRAHVLFDVPCPAPAPGQGAVFYIDDVVVGGGVIARWLNNAL